MEQRALEDEIRQELSPLNRVTLSREADQKIRANLQEAIQSYESGTRHLVANRRHRRNRILPVMSAAVFVIAAAGVTYYGLSNRVHEQTKPRTVAHNTDLSNITYTNQTIQTIQGTARQTGVLVYLPHKVLPGGKVTVVKNGGNDTAILDFNRIWIIESSKPIDPPQSQYVKAKESVTLPGGTKGVFYQIKNNNNALYFKQGKTYIAIQHLRGQLPTKQQLIAIANSLKLLPTSTNKMTFGTARYTQQELSNVKSQENQIGTVLYLPRTIDEGDALSSIHQATGTFTSGKTVELQFHKFVLFESAGRMSIPGGISNEKNVQIGNTKNGRFAIAELKRTNGSIQSASVITFKKGNAFIQIRSLNGKVLSENTLMTIAKSLSQK